MAIFAAVADHGLRAEAVAAVAVRLGALTALVEHLLGGAAPRFEVMRQLRSEHPLDQSLGQLGQQALVAHDRLRRMAAFGDQYVQRLVQRFVFLRFGSSHLFLSSGLTLHTNFLTGSFLVREVGVRKQRQPVHRPRT